MVAQSDKFENWLPMSEVLARTGLSQRTVYRMVSQGQLEQAQRRIPGRRPQAIFSPEGVAQIVASTSGNRPDDGTIGAMLPPSELSFKLYLTEEEAIRYTGFGPAYIRAHGKGRPIGPDGAVVYRRVDLEKL